MTTDELHVLARLTAEGFWATRTSLYDEEGVEGWRWEAPFGHPLEHGEWFVIGDWDERPPVPEELEEYAERVCTVAANDQ